jgi:hypothetical protein
LYKEEGEPTEEGYFRVKEGQDIKEDWQEIYQTETYATVGEKEVNCELLQYIEVTEAEYDEAYNTGKL